MLPRLNGEKYFLDFITVKVDIETVDKGKVNENNFLSLSKHGKFMLTLICTYKCLSAVSILCYPQTTRFKFG